MSGDLFRSTAAWLAAKNMEAMEVASVGHTGRTAKDFIIYLSRTH
jgi:hypothetical protein